MKKLKLAIILGLFPIWILADSAWIGNGSIMSAYKNNVSDKVYRTASSNTFGVTRDMTVMHDLSSTNIAFFQWFVDSKSCKRLKIKATTTDGKYYITPKVNITIGSWSSRVKDRTFEKVTLPFIISKENVNYSKWFENQSWNVVAIEIVDGTDTGNIYAECTNEVEDIQTDTPIRFGHKIKVDNGYVWNGNASIISAYFKSQLYNNWNTPRVGSNSQWPYGVFKDVSTFSPKYEKQVVFFQWQRSKECSQLKIDMPTAPKSKKSVKLISKEWNESPFVVFEEYIDLPYILKNKEKNLWTVLGVYTDESFDKQHRVEVSCCTAPNYKNLFKIKNPSCKQRWNMYSRFKYEKVLSSQRNIITAKIHGTDRGHEIIKNSLELADYVMDYKKKTLNEGAKRAFKVQIESAFPNANTDFIDGLSSTLADLTISAAEVAYGASTGDYKQAIKSQSTKILGIFNDLQGVFQLDSLTEEMYTSLIVTYYLEEYYAWGGDAKKVATENGLSSNSSLETVIDAIASKHGNHNDWWGTEYYTDDAKKMITNIINNVIPPHTQGCLDGGCN